MDKLDQYAISKILGSRMTPVKRAKFGNFGLLETTGEVLRARQASNSSSAAMSFSYDEDRLAVQAFEEVRQGVAVDAILWDQSFAAAFTERCRQLGLIASDAFLKRRLLNVRKNIQRYKEHGITIAPATKSERRPSIVPQYAHVIEFALVRLRYRFGASIDDILLDPELGQKFEQLASQLAPGLADTDLRLGALYIRKSRAISRKKPELERIEHLDVNIVEEAWSTPVRLASLNIASVPSSPGLIELKEGERYLYISHSDDLRPAVEQMRSGKAFNLVANGFWAPNFEEIRVQFAIGAKIGDTRVDKWDKRLIRDREPIFNWPIPKRAA